MVSDPDALIRRFGLGRTTNIHDTQAFSRDLANALEVSDTYVETEAIRRMLCFHSTANFVASMSARYCRHMRLGGPLDIKPWQWVLDAQDQ